MHITADDFINFGERLSAEIDAAHDLWTWLPSYAVTERHHGDYVQEHRPGNADVMKEASMYLAHLRRPDLPLTEKEREWFGTCACGNGCENEGVL